MVAVMDMVRTQLRFRSASWRRADGSIYLAVNALLQCMDRLRHLRLVHLHDRAHRRGVSHRFPGRFAFFVWGLGLTMAGLQPSCYGLHMVRSAILDRR